MSNPLCNLYVDAGCPLGELDIDNVNQWAFDHIQFLEDKICQLRFRYDEAVIQHVEEMARITRQVNMEEHYKHLSERHLTDSTRYQALLFHAWHSLSQQQKGLRRQAKKIKRLREQLAKDTPDIYLTLK